MEFSSILGVIHALILIAVTSRSTTRLVTGLSQRLCAGFLLLWANLVYTGMLTATFSKLDRRGLYFSVSVALAIGLEAWLSYRCLAALPPASEPKGIATDELPRYLRVALWGTLLSAALGSALICLAYVPNNWDSCTYRFSRPFFYLAKGSLFHFGASHDPRLLFYPFNGSLLYLFIATYEFGPKWMYAVTFVGWVCAGLGSHFVARCLGASRDGAFVAAWICLLSPSVLAQIASTNDEMLSAVPILIGVGFAMQWYATARLRSAVLAGIGIGLGFGSKLHWVFYVFFVMAATLLIGIRVIQSRQFRGALIARIPALFAASAVALPLVVTFLVCNYVSSGRLTNQEFNNAVLNRPFRLSLAREKIRINTAELFLSPIPDLVPPINREQTKGVYTAFNKFFMRHWFSDLVEVTKRSPEGYIFEGPANPEGAGPHEYTVWLGFVPHLLLLVCLAGLLTRRLPWPAVAVAASFFFWHVTYSTQNRYIPTASVYYSFPVVLACASLGSAWDYTRFSRQWASRILAVGFLVVLTTNVLLSANLLAFGGLRNLQFVFKGSPPEMHPVAPDVVKAIQAARRVYIPYTHWEILYWNLMRFNPGAKYTTGLDIHPPLPDTMMLLSLARDGAGDLVPARLPRDTVRGLTYLGDADSTPIFGQGGGLEKSGTGRSGYMLLPVWWTLDDTGRITGLVRQRSEPSRNLASCIGLEPSDGIEFRYELRSSVTGDRLVHEWSGPDEPDSGLSSPSKETFDTFLIETRATRRPDLVARTLHQLQAQPYVIGKDETFSGVSAAPASGRTPGAVVSIPSLASEPYSYHGQGLTVSWLRKETELSITNSGRLVSATLELQLATFGKPHTAVLQANGRAVGVAQTVRRVMWVDGWDTAQFAVRLSPGENRFTLVSKESADRLPDGRDVCFLLVGDPKIIGPKR